MKKLKYSAHSVEYIEINRINIKYYEKDGPTPHLLLVYCTGKGTWDHGGEGAKHPPLRGFLSFNHDAKPQGVSPMITTEGIRKGWCEAPSPLSLL